MFPTEAMPVLIPIPISSIGLSLRAPFRLQFGEASQHIHGAEAAALGVIGLVKRSAPDGHHRVADVFIERALVAKNDPRHLGEVAVQQGPRVPARRAIPKSW